MTRAADMDLLCKSQPFPERELSQLAALRQPGGHRTRPAPFPFNLKPSTLNLPPPAILHPQFSILAPK